MAHGIESRVPFINVPVIELAAKISRHIKYPKGELKAMLRCCRSTALSVAMHYPSPFMWALKLQFHSLQKTPMSEFS
jgi:hypothetical protein